MTNLLFETVTQLGLEPVGEVQSNTVLVQSLAVYLETHPLLLVPAGERYWILCCVKGQLIRLRDLRPLGYEEISRRVARIQLLHCLTLPTDPHEYRAFVKVLNNDPPLPPLQAAQRIHRRGRAPHLASA